MSAESIQRRRGVVAVIVRDDRFLIIRRAEGIAAPLAFCFPGGGIEAGEDEPLALIRELQEELGVLVQPRRRLWRSTTAWSVELSWWLAELNHVEKIRPNPAEVASFHWQTREEIEQLPGLLSSNLEFFTALKQGEFRIDE